jgi:serine/threonine-protein kinase RsbW
VASHYWKKAPEPREVSRLRNELRHYAAQNGLVGPVVEDMALAVTEVFTNAVLHAFPPERTDGTITVMATINGDDVTLRIVDDGVGITPRVDSPGAGLGLAIAGRVAERMVVEHPERGGTEVRMTFSRAA